MAAYVRTELAAIGGLATALCIFAGCFYGHPLTGVLPEEAAESDVALALAPLLAGAGAGADSGTSAPDGIPADALALNYPAAPTLIRAQMMTRLKPTPEEGSVSSCAIDPALPAGLGFATPDCSITGAPTGGSSTTAHTIIAQLDTGAMAATQLTLQVDGDFRYIYVTTNFHNGDSIGGASGADTICNGDDGLFPVGSSFRALLGVTTGIDRHACNGPGEAGCLSGGATANWSLAANTEYRRPDGVTVIGTSNANRIIELPMDNSFAGAGGSAWSGMEANWNTISGATAECSGWSAAGNGNIFLLNDATGVNAGTLSCATPAALVCVEQ